MSTARAHLEVLPSSVKLTLGLGLIALVLFPWVDRDRKSTRLNSSH